LRLALAAARKQDQTADAHFERQIDKRADGCLGARHGKIRVVADVDRTDAFQRRRPSGAIVPIEGRHGGAGAEPDRQTSRGEAVGDAPSSLAGAAEDQCGLGGINLLARHDILQECEQLSRCEM
jgi:hypothetical protein